MISDASFVDYNSLFIYGFCKCFVCFIISIHWIVILIHPKWTKNIQIIPYIGSGFKSVFMLVCRCKFLSYTYLIVKEPFDYPIRIKAAAIISFGLCFVVNLSVTCKQIVIYSYKIYDVIDDLYSFKHYLSSQKEDYIFIYINTEYPIAIYANQGLSLLKLLIYLLEPIYWSLTVALFLGLCIVSVSILNMLYQFKKIILTIIEEGEDSETLNTIWKFSSHSSIFFCSQFVLNSVFLNFIFATSVFFVCYIISFRETYFFIYDYVKTRGYQFWVGLVPVILG